MLNYLWGIMIIIGVIWGAFTGNIEAVTNGALNSAKEAVTLCITMLGVVSLWTGIMEVAKGAGIIKKMTKAISPFVMMMTLVMTLGIITTNIIANFLGLGWAATPPGLKAMEELEKLNKKPGVASNEMCTFLILNISSLQLIPVNIIAYRSQYGSVNPASILGPAIVATLFSTVVGIIFAKIMDRGRR